MEFKIDTKDNFAVITPVYTTIDANLAGELERKCEEIRQNGSKNLIIDLQHCATAQSAAVEMLVALHEISYSEDNSLVFTGIGEMVMPVVKAAEAHLVLNIAPKMIEAADIINMEVLERDLMNEED